MVLNSAFGNGSLILQNADLKVGPMTLRLTHAAISSEIELLLTLNEKSLHDTVSEAILSSKIQARGGLGSLRNENHGISREHCKQRTRRMSDSVTRLECEDGLIAHLWVRQLDVALYFAIISI